ncbi:MAG TPA: thioredoxin domain-containing protein [Candidatus Paceibacterota bacterium]|nr:thioredoxin domain-containing protein [Candidatus Paceibacterota bacterium]
MPADHGNKRSAVSDNKYLVPLSIIIAGLIVAGAVYFSRTPTSAPAAGTQNQPQQQNTDATIRPVDPAKDHILGDPNAPIELVEYSDAQCPFCRAFHPTITSIMSTYGKDGTVNWVYREFPLDSIHPDAHRRALGLECAAQEGGNSAFWSLLNSLFAIDDNANEGTPDLGAMAKQAGLDETAFNTCLNNKAAESLVAADESDALQAGAQGTPFIVMVFKNGVNSATKNAVSSLQAKYSPDVVYVSTDGKRVVIGGALPLADFQTILDAATK